MVTEEGKMGVSRRGFFRTVGAAGLGVAAVSAQPGKLWAAENVMDSIKAKMGGSDVTEGKVVLSTPDTAENGSLVRVPIKVDHPMEPGNFIESVGIFVDNNPAPFIAKFDFKPELGGVDFEVRIKIAKTSPLRVVAKSNTGKLYAAVKNINVAEGGCA
ncbi:thiosulfate-binding protein SoxY [Magnetococcus marinus MC-1]|uniref:Thiosulfate-binding protein SoxY n=1 Tax=Magnetococcus marinus (strain ATCC BAA-1437 / JCM 17883 / MC-1) TaxID=156889 RepID=A0LBZ5_MAGMM|nr:thiosulfate oxidation carrier protein SoxY [Magnetococcus marinus]ABK45488.1 thiosulfate-binding protein SoxY [Magnetococcus marinus MC-1]